MSKQRLHLLSVALVPALCLLAGCASLQSTFKEGLSQEVSVATFPAGAEVWMGGTQVGTTPLVVDLGRKQTHRIEFRHPGYHTTFRTVAPRDNERAGNVVKFGLLRDTGYYQELIPDRLEVVLDHQLVPAQLSPTPFEDLAHRIVEADRLLASGEMGALEHRILTQRLQDIYRGW